MFVRCSREALFTVWHLPSASHPNALPCSRVHYLCSPVSLLKDNGSCISERRVLRIYLVRHPQFCRISKTRAFVVLNSREHTISVGSLVFFVQHRRRRLVRTCSSVVLRRLVFHYSMVVVVFPIPTKRTQSKRPHPIARKRACRGMDHT